MKKNPDTKNAAKAVELTDEDAEAVAGGLSFGGNLDKSIGDAVKRFRSVSGVNHDAPKGTRGAGDSLPGKGGKSISSANTSDAAARERTDKDRGGW